MNGRVYVHPTALSPYWLAVLEALTRRRAVVSASGRAVRLVAESGPARPSRVRDAADPAPGKEGEA